MQRFNVPMVSLGDAINHEQNFKDFCKRPRFQSKIRDKFGFRFLVNVTKLIKSCPDCIEKVDIYQIRSILYLNCLKMIEKVKIN